jgi:DNA-binding CsgD family transcriptional regulator
MNLSEKDWLKIIDILSEINRQYDIHTLREVVLERIGEVIDYDLAIFDLSKFENSKFVALYDPVVRSIFSESFEKQFISDYDTKYFKMSYMNWIYFQEKNLVYRDSDFIKPEIKNESQFYKEYMEPRGLLHACGCNLVYNKLCIGAISIVRKNDKTDFTEEDLFILEQLQPHIINKLMQYIDLSSEADFKNKLRDVYKITSREMEIVNLIYLFYENKEIAEILDISTNTVKKHVNNIFSKIDVNSRGQLISFLKNNDFYTD